MKNRKSHSACAAAIGVFVALSGNSWALQIAPSYDANLPTEYKSAIERACALWESWLVPGTNGGGAILTIEFEAFASDNFAAGADIDWRDFSTGVALSAAQALDSGAVDQKVIDGSIVFSTNQTWSFDPDLNPTSAQRDLLSTTLHEIGHHLGFATSYQTTAVGTWGILDGSQLRLTAWDTHLVDDQGRSPDVTNDLFNVTGPVTFQGVNANLVAGSDIPIYAPATYEGGSSLSHVAIGAMMARTRPSGTTRRGIHAFELAILEDLGWTVRHPATTVTTGIAPVAQEHVGDTEPSWHQGAHWAGDPTTTNPDTGLFIDAGLPPDASTRVSLLPGNADYSLRIYEAPASAKGLHMVASATSSPSLYIDEGGLLMVGEGVDLEGGQMNLAPNATASSESLRVRGGSLVLSNAVYLADNVVVEAGSVSITRSTFVGGAWTVAGGSVTAFGDSRAGNINADGFSITGGHVAFSGDAHLNVAVGTEFKMQGGTISILGDAASINNGHLLLNGGAMTLSGNLNGDSGELNNGTIVVRGTTGRLNIGSSSAPSLPWRDLDIVKDASEIQPVELTINTDMRWLAGTRTVQSVALKVNGNVLEAEGVLELRAGSSLIVNGNISLFAGADVLGDPPSTWLLNGNLNKHDNAFSLVEPHLTLNGNIDVLEGTLRVSSSGTQSGSIHVAAGATFEAPPDYQFSQLQNQGTFRYLGDVTCAIDISLDLGASLFVDGVFTQDAAGILRGLGTIFGNVLIGGLLAPGFSPGTLSVGGNLTLDPGSHLAFELGSTTDTNDFLRVFDENTSDSIPRGNLILDGTLDLEAVEGFGVGSYALIGFDGTLEDRGLEVTNLPEGLEGRIVVDQRQVLLVVSVPESSTAALLIGGFAALGQLRLRRVPARVLK